MLGAQTNRIGAARPELPAPPESLGFPESLGAGSFVTQPKPGETQFPRLFRALMLSYL